EAQAFIVKNEWFSKHLKADIIESNFQTNTIVLSNFTYLLNMPAIQREFVRVHPDILAKVYLRPSHSLPTSGRLYDLSINGLGVVSSENNGIYVGAKVSVTFELNSATIAIDGDKTIELQGEIVNIIDYQGSFRYCMRIFPDRIMSKKILNYISQREKEILEDLNQELEAYSV
ncbi:MAG: PilZ domain-containing protein, partial [Epsilonproteobacteria bacterium]|nr:PilZ domain-containing protein [Campylobacterota bacterium]